MAMKAFGYVKIDIVNALYLIIDNVDEYIKEGNVNRYSTLVSTDKTKMYWQNTQSFGMWSKTWLKKINGKQGEYGKDFIKMKLRSDGNLPLNKLSKLHTLTIVVRSVFSRRQIVLSRNFF